MLMRIFDFSQTNNVHPPHLFSEKEELSVCSYSQKQSPLHSLSLLWLWPQLLIHITNDDFLARQLGNISQHGRSSHEEHRLRRLHRPLLEFGQGLDVCVDFSHTLSICRQKSCCANARRANCKKRKKARAWKSTDPA